MKDLIALIWARVVCLFKGHLWGKTVRDVTSPRWQICVFEAPVTRDVIKCERRSFTAHRFCDRCGSLETLNGYDQRPAQNDPFENARKTKENSPVNIITEEHARKLFPNYDAKPKA